LVKFGTYTLPNVETWVRVKPRIFVETAIPDAEISDRQDLGSLGRVVEILGKITGTPTQIRNAITDFEALADGAKRLFDFETEDPTFNAIMLDPEFTKVFPTLVRYRVRIVQVSPMPYEGDVLIDSFVVGRYALEIPSKGSVLVDSVIVGTWDITSTSGDVYYDETLDGSYSL